MVDVARRATSAASAPALPMPAWPGDQRRDRGRLGVDPGADLLERRRRRGRASASSVARVSAFRLRRRDAPRPRRRFRSRQAGQQPFASPRRPARRRSRVRSASSLTWRSKPAACSRRFAADRAQLLGQRRALSARRAADRRAARAISVRAASAARSSASPCRDSVSLLLSNSRVIAPSLPVAWSPSRIRCCAIIAQLGAAVVDPLRQHLEQCLQRSRFGAHRDDRTGELLGFLAPGPAEHQPDEAHQRQRPGGDRDPLRDLRRRQRLAGQRPPGGPGGIADPQRGEDRQRRQAPAGRPLARSSARMLGPCSWSNVGSTKSRCRLQQLDGLCRVAGRWQAVRRAVGWVSS